MSQVSQESFVAPAPPIIRNIYTHHVGRENIKVVGRKFHCQITGCKYICRLYGEFDKHLESSHHAEYIQLIQYGAGSGSQLNTGIFELDKEAHYGTMYELVHIFDPGYISFEKAFSHVKTDLTSILMHLINQYRGAEMKIIIECEMMNEDTGATKQAAFITPFIRYLYPHVKSIENNLITSVAYMDSVLLLYESGGSNWKLHEIQRMLIKIGQYNSMIGYGKMKEFTIPKPLNRKKLLIPQSSDGCFATAVLIGLFYKDIYKQHFGDLKWSALKPYQRRKRRILLEDPNSYTSIMQRMMKSKEIDFTGYLAGVDIYMIDEFEMRNAISVNVFEFVDDRPSPIRLTEYSFPRHVDLLFIRYLDRGISHYATITDRATFTGKQGVVKRQRCRYCMKPSVSHNDIHESICKRSNCNSVYTSKEPFYSFDGHRALQDIAFKCYYMFHYSKSSLDDRLSVFAYAYILIGPDGNEIKRDCKTDTSAEEFWNVVEDIIKYTQRILQETNVPIILTREQEIEFEQVDCCMHCGEEFTDELKSVLHHHHLLPDVPVEKICNTCNCKIKHNAISFVTYDSCDLAFRSLINAVPYDKLDKLDIVGGSNKTITAMYYKRSSFINFYKFFDSGYNAFGFSDENVTEFAKQYQWAYQEHCKFTFCYPYIIDRTFSTESTDQSFFTSDVNGTVMSSRDYNALSNFAETLGLNCHQRLFKFILMSSVCRLGLSAQYFTHVCMEKFKLAPLQFPTLPSLAYQVLMYSVDKIQTLPQEFVEFITPHIRGGISLYSNKITTANCDSYPSYNPDLEHCTIIGMDINSCYAYALSQNVGVGGYEWMSREELDTFNYSKVNNNCDYGFIFEVDLEVNSTAVMDKYNDCPLAPYKVHVTLGSTKLALDFLPKYKYVVDYKLLEYYINSGMELKRVHRGMKYNTRPVFADFVEKITSLRTEMKRKGDLISAEMYKLFINAITGKCISSTKDFTRTEFVTTRRRAQELLSFHSLSSFDILGPNLSLFYMKHVRTKYMYPVLIGFEILEKSKLHLYRQIDFTKTVLPRASIVSVNTDGFFLKIPMDRARVLQLLSEYSMFFDFSSLKGDDDFSKTLFHTINEGQPGTLKLTHYDIMEIIYTNTKSYSLILLKDLLDNSANPVGTRKCTSIPTAVSKQIEHAKFRESVLSNIRTVVHYNRLQRSSEYGQDAKVESVFSTIRNSTDHRFFLDDGSSYAFGHYKGMTHFMNFVIIIIAMEIKSPVRMVIIGSSGCGKTMLVLDLIKKHELIFDKPLDGGILYLFSQAQSSLDQFQQDNPNIDIKFTSDVEEANQFIDRKGHTLLVIDDFLAKMDTKSFASFINDLFLGRSRHTNTSVIFISQSVFGSQLRTVRVNSTHLILFPFKQDRRSISALASQILPRKSRFFLDSYLDATSKRHGYLSINFDTDEPEPTLCNFIYPRVGSIVYKQK